MSASQKLRTVSDGRKLAIKFLYELRENDSDLSCCEAYPRAGKPQTDLLGPYLRIFRDAGPDVEAGFLVIMNDFLGASFGGPVDPELYDRLERNSTVAPLPIRKRLTGEAYPASAKVYRLSEHAQRTRVDVTPEP